MSTKIVVIKFKELLKKAVFVIVGLIIIGILVYIFIPKGDNEQALYEPGTYSAEIILHNSPVRVDVTVNESEIVDIQMTELGETQSVFYPLLEPTAKEVAEEIIDKQNLEIEASADKSMTTQIIVNAVGAALEKAEINKSDKSDKVKEENNKSSMSEETNELSSSSETITEVIDD